MNKKQTLNTTCDFNAYEKKTQTVKTMNIKYIETKLFLFQWLVNIRL